MQSLLLMDVGNSNIKLGVSQQGILAHRWRISTVPHRTEDEIGLLIRGLLSEVRFGELEFDGIVICSVVPPMMPTLGRMCQKYFGRSPLVIGPGVKSGLNMKVENPREVGADRIVNAVGALRTFEPPIVVVDFGTATTFSVVDETGTFIGGAISPGLGIAAEALFQSAAKLPRVDLVRPKNVIGRNMVSSMQSGILYGFIGLVEGMLDKIINEVPLSYTVVATGGFSALLGPEVHGIQHIIPDLTLAGLQVLWEINGAKGVNL